MSYVLIFVLYYILKIPHMLTHGEQSGNLGTMIYSLCFEAQLGFFKSWFPFSTQLLPICKYIMLLSRCLPLIAGKALLGRNIGPKCALHFSETLVAKM